VLSLENQYIHKNIWLWGNSGSTKDNH